MRGGQGLVALKSDLWENGGDFNFQKEDEKDDLGADFGFGGGTFGLVKLQQVGDN